MVKRILLILDDHTFEELRNRKPIGVTWERFLIEPKLRRRPRIATEKGLGMPAQR
ncbi:MAG: hypothetical protein ACE5OY_06865 [Candidatus Bathyarchaeia archaeon]